MTMSTSLDGCLGRLLRLKLARFRQHRLCDSVHIYEIHHGRRCSSCRDDVYEGAESNREGNAGQLYDHWFCRLRRTFGDSSPLQEIRATQSYSGQVRPVHSFPPRVHLQGLQDHNRQLGQAATAHASHRCTSWAPEALSVPM